MNTSKTTAPPCWLDLPLEVVGEILSRLPTHDDRLRFRTVCREWHLVARHHRSLLPPAVPCINLDNDMYQSIVTDDHNSKVYGRRFPTPTGFHVRATFSDWVMYRHNHFHHQNFLYKPSSPSMPAIKAPCWYEQTLKKFTGNYNPSAIFLIKKIVCSSPLVASLNSTALLIDAPVGSDYFTPKTTNVLLTRQFIYRDITFHRGKTFAVSSTEHLFSHWLDDEALSQSLTDPMEGLFSHWSSGEMPYRIRTEHVIKEQPSAVVAAADKYYHLVTSADNQKLFMVRWGIPQLSNNIEAHNQAMTLQLQVFEAQLDKGMWLEVKDLGSQVLFVGPTGSRAFLAEGSSEHYYSQTSQRGNRVFILGHDWDCAWRLAEATLYNERQKLADDIPIYCVYGMVTGKSSLVGQCSPESFKADWFFSSG